MQPSSNISRFTRESLTNPREDSALTRSVTDESFPVADRQRIANCFPTADRLLSGTPEPTTHRRDWCRSQQLLVGCRVVPLPLSPFPRRSATASRYARKALISRLSLQDERPRPPAEGDLDVTGCRPPRLAEPTVRSLEVLALAAIRGNDAVSEESPSGLSDALSVRTQ